MTLFSNEIPVSPCCCLLPAWKGKRIQTVWPQFARGGSGGELSEDSSLENDGRFLREVHWRHHWRLVFGNPMMKSRLPFSKMDWF